MSVPTPESPAARLAIAVGALALLLLLPVVPLVLEFVVGVVRGVLDVVVPGGRPLPSE